MAKIELKPKSSLSALDIRALIIEFNELLLGGIIDNVYLVKELLMLKIRCRDGITRLLAIKPPQWISISKYDVEKPALPPPFCQLLRKHLRDGRILEIKQIGLDRVIEIDVAKREDRSKLIVEFVREGNIILCNDEMMILGAYREATYRDRTIKRGEKYKLPPNLIFEISEERAVKLLSEIRKPTVFHFAITLLGSPEVAYEVLMRCGIDPTSDMSKLDLELIRRIVDKAHEVIRSLNSMKPSIIYINGKPFSVVPIEFSMYRDYEKKGYETFSDAVSDFFYEALKSGLVKEEEKRLEEEEGRLRATISELKAKINELTAKADALKRAIDYVTSNYEVFQELLASFRESWSKREELPKSKPLEEIKISKVDLKEKVVVIDVQGVHLKFKPYETLMANISRFYEELKELKRKINASKQALGDLERKLEELSKLRSETFTKVEEKIRLRREVRRWFERFLWFKSSDDFLVVAGRDATQNEVLVKKYLEDEDLFLHADIVGAPAVIVKTYGKRPPETTIREAAQFAACYSRAWKMGFGSIDVYWVYGSQVSKTPPSGEYLQKGSFMIRGERNYLKGIELKIAIGLQLTENEALIISGPQSAIARQSISYVVLAPGDSDKSRIANRIAKMFNERLKSLGFASINIRADDVIRVIPPGTAKIISKGEGHISAFSENHLER